MIDLTTEEKKEIVITINKKPISNYVSKFYSELRNRFENEVTFNQNITDEFKFTFMFYFGGIIIRFIYYDFDEVVNISEPKITMEDYFANKQKFNDQNIYRLICTNQILQFNLNEKYLEDTINKIITPFYHLMNAANNDKFQLFEKLKEISPFINLPNKSVNDASLDLHAESFSESYETQKRIILEAAKKIFLSGGKINPTQICNILNRKRTTMIDHWNNCGIKYNGKMKIFYNESTKEIFLDIKNFSVTSDCLN